MNPTNDEREKLRNSGVYLCCYELESRTVRFLFQNMLTAYKEIKELAADPRTLQHILNGPDYAWITMFMSNDKAAAFYASSLMDDLRRDAKELIGEVKI